MPFVSVVVPTRNRPEFVRSALKSLRNQTFEDFEVIVVDNHTGKPCRAVFEEIADARFRYIVPSHPLPMHDNWELGVRHTVGTYVAVLIDKTVLRSQTLELLNGIALRLSADLVSWWADAYTSNDPGSGGNSQGVCHPWPRPVRAPQVFDSRDELARRFRMDVRRGNEGENYFLGKICFGAYRRDLIDRIVSSVGRLFFPLAPDYTSMLSALALSRRPVNAGRPGLVQSISHVSNGWSMAHSPEHARTFIEETDPSGAIIEALPIPGLYTSVHNLVGYDYQAMRRRLDDAFPGVRLDMANLVVRAAEDLEDVGWTDAALRLEQRTLLRNYADALVPSEELQRSLRRHIRAHGWRRLKMTVRRGIVGLPLGNAVLHLGYGALSNIVRRPGGTSGPKQFTSVLAAAEDPLLDLDASVK